MEYFITIYKKKEEQKHGDMIKSIENIYTVEQLLKRIEKLIIDKELFTVAEGKCIMDLS